MAKTDDNEVSLSAKKAEKDEREAFLLDVEAGTEPEWEAVVVPEWKGRTVWIRSLSSGQRAKWRRDGYKSTKNEMGESVIEETGEAEPILIQLSTYIEMPDGSRKLLFPQGPDGRDLIKRQRGGGANDRLLEVALRISGLTKKREDQAKADFLDSPTSTDDSDSPEI